MNIFDIQAIEPVGQPEDHANIAGADLLFDCRLEGRAQVGKRMPGRLAGRRAAARDPGLKHRVVSAPAGMGSPRAADALGHRRGGQALGQQFCGLMPVDDAPHRAPAVASPARAMARKVAASFGAAQADDGWEEF